MVKGGIDKIPIRMVPHAGYVYREISKYEMELSVPLREQKKHM